MRHSARRSGSRRCSHEKNADAEEFPNIRPHTGGRIKLRILGTAISLLEELRLGAERDLGMDIEFDNQDFMTAQHKAALEPMTYDIYDQCFHNLDIVWYWRAVQPIDIELITLWAEIIDLTKTGPHQAECPARARRSTNLPSWLHASSYVARRAHRCD